MEATLPSRRTARAAAETRQSQISISTEIAKRVDVCDPNDPVGYYFLFEDKTGPGNFGESLLVCHARIMPRGRDEVNIFLR